MNRRVILVVVGLIFELSVLGSMFDIWFTSPLVHGQNLVPEPESPPAKRLVLFVVDGLRAESFYERFDSDYKDTGGQWKAPFLREKAIYEGRYGVLHTRVPTETRPGHVALCAGFYEDLSAVTVGWNDNPVEFDHVFNRSAVTLSWGSPDVVRMFQKSYAANHVHAWHYDHDYQDFGAEDIFQVDSWVFDRVAAAFNPGSDLSPTEGAVGHGAGDSDDNNVAADGHDKDFFREALDKDKLIVFAHLLGMDSVGHAVRAGNPKYHNHIRTVDERIAELVASMEDYWNHDGQTVYVMTSDHGMNNRGGHGDGDPLNTQVPFVVWGAGIRKTGMSIDPAFEYSGPLSIETGARRWYGDAAQYHGWIPEDWDDRQDGLPRVDVSQADFAPLMSALIGVSPPVHNVGVIPLPLLAGMDKWRAEVIVGNAAQRVETVRVRAGAREGRGFWSVPFPEMNRMEGALVEAQKALRSGNHAIAVEKSFDAMERAQRGDEYYTTYDTAFLMTIMTMAYLGWGATVVLELLIPPHVEFQAPSNPILGLMTFLSLAVHGWLLSEGSPWRFHMYWAWAIGWTCWAVSRLGSWVKLSDRGFSGDSSGRVVWLLLLSSGVFVLRTYYDRPSLAVAFILLWLGGYSQHQYALGAMLIPLTGTFTLLPLEAGDYPLLVTGSSLVITAGVVVYVWCRQVVWDPAPFGGRLHRRSLALFALYMVMGLGAVLLYNSTNADLASDRGLVAWKSYCAWGLLGVSFMLVWFSGPAAVDGYVTVAAFVNVVLTLASVAYELTFAGCYALGVAAWTVVEVKTVEQASQAGQVRWEVASQGGGEEGRAVRKMLVSDIRAAFGMLALIHVGFFGPGNKASISSYEISSTYRFVTVFDPWIMGGLLVFKAVIPLGLPAAAMWIYVRSTRWSMSSFVLLLASGANMLGLSFFYLMDVDGTWLDIGASIARYTIAHLFLLIAILIVAPGAGLTAKRYVDTAVADMKTE